MSQIPMDATLTEDQAPPKRRHHRLADNRWQPGELLLWAMPCLAFFVFEDHLLLGSQILITALFVLSLDLLIGYSGIVSLGHAAFFGTGAYTAGLLATHGWHEPLSGLLAACLVAGCLGFISSFLVVRGHGLTQLVVTLGLGLLLHETANKAAFITGGVDGLYGIELDMLLGRFEFDFIGKTAYLYSLAVLFICYVLIKRMLHSPFGLALRGMHEGPDRMPALGASINRRKTIMFTLSAAIAGLAGALLTHLTQFVGIDTLSFHRSAEAMIILILGGTGKLYGSLLGAGCFLVAHDMLSDLNPAYWQFWIGLLLVLVVLLAKGGMVAVLEGTQRRLFGGRK